MCQGCPAMVFLEFVWCIVGGERGKGSPTVAGARKGELFGMGYGTILAHAGDYLPGALQDPIPPLYASPNPTISTTL
ncbi:hypothetical protein HOY82DRAFT_551598 [Tuber indicum]|nr:hypothetical protein HOY82DRAFT_551598 [Tuber indicum]